MTRAEEIKQAAVEHAKSSLIGSLYYKESSFRQGAEWADYNPRTDTIGVDSISYIRRILIRNFHNITRRYHNVTISDVPEINEAFDMIVNFDKACESAGWVFDNENGIYVMK